MNETRAKLTRRDFLQRSLIAGGTVLFGFDRMSWLQPSKAADKDLFQGGKQVGIVDFVGESPSPLDTVLGAELDGRLYTDVSSMTPENLVTPTERFYIRTRASELLENEKPWLIRLGGLVEQPLNLTLEDLKGMVKPDRPGKLEATGGV
jgi:hypothetical protein